MKKQILALCALMTMASAAQALIQTPLQMAYTEQIAVMEALKDNYSLQYHFPLSFKKQVSTGNIEVVLMDTSVENSCSVAFYRPVRDNMGFVTHAELVTQTGLWECPAQEQWIVLTSKVEIEDSFQGFTYVNLPNAKLQFSTDGVDKNTLDSYMKGGLFQAVANAESGVAEVKECNNARVTVAADPGNFLPHPPNVGEMWMVPRILDVTCLD